jgi:DtxR family Mn-dependent transcriptional regulator
MTLGDRVEVRRVDTSEPDRLRYLGGIGLVPGAVVTVAGKEPFDGPLSVEVEGRRHVLGHELARVLLCARHARPA